MSWSTSELRVRLAPLNRFKPSSKIFYWPFQGGTSFVDLLCFCSVLCLLCLCARLFILGLSRYSKSVSRYIAICGKHIAIIPQYIVPKCQHTFWVKMKRILTWHWILKPRVFAMCPQQDSKASNLPTIWLAIDLGMVLASAIWNVFNQHSSDLIPHLLVELLGGTGERVIVGLTWDDPQLCLESPLADWDTNLNLLFCQYTYCLVTMPTDI